MCQYSGISTHGESGRAPLPADGVQLVVLEEVSGAEPRHIRFRDAGGATREGARLAGPPEHLLRLRPPDGRICGRDRGDAGKNWRLRHDLLGVYWGGGKKGLCPQRQVSASVGERQGTQVRTGFCGWGAGLTDTRDIGVRGIIVSSAHIFRTKFSHS